MPILTLRRYSRVDKSGAIIGTYKNLVSTLSVETSDPWCNCSFLMTAHAAMIMMVRRDNVDVSSAQLRKFTLKMKLSVQLCTYKGRKTATTLDNVKLCLKLSLSAG